MSLAWSAPQLGALPGDPDRLSDAGTRYAGVAEQIQSIADLLHALADEDASRGEAADHFRTEARGTATGIVEALPRYETTAAALTEYAVALRAAQDDALRAAEDLEDARAAVIPLYGALDSARLNADAAATREDDPPRWMLDEVTRLEQSIDTHEQTIRTSLALYEQAVEDRDRAAERAADLIEPVLEALNDGFWDDWNGFWRGVGDFFAGAGEWIASFAEWVFTALATLVTALIVLAVALTALSLLLAPGFALTLLATGTTPEQVLDAVIAASLALTVMLNAPMATLLAIEAIKPTPHLDYVGVSPVATHDRETGRAYSAYERLFQQAAALDELGGSDATVIEIVQVGTEDGRPVWRVTVPSTKDWEGFGFGIDQGAANDLGSNYALMLAPHHQAAYERMVVEAMTRAGIGPDDPVMVTGWSQGGILAAKMASDPASPFNIEAIAVAGAPVDHMAIPEDVSVVSLQHAGDPVHRLDGQAPPPDRAGWVTIGVDPSGGSGAGVLPVDVSQHSAALYADTAAALDSGDLVAAGAVDRATQDAYGAVAQSQGRFFADDEVAYVYRGAEGF
ncbi:putative T7SS-secreted protein [Microbacterium album]|uniref:Putative T7SS secretion signal domain-containing protein n=1 Tax=Microbacterium album TaxID=2053191 RepID=A0A917MLK3_9MICO|nr:hypothetical protein [Microbacterium album]GGH42921.1 hypothetical protein GCM10010921_16460 [Microbacterium album]